MISSVVVIGCSRGTKLAKAIAKKLHARFCDINMQHFSGNEMLISSAENLENKTVIIVQSCDADANSNLMEILLASDMASNAGAAEIHLVLSYVPYARQDRELSRHSSIGMHVVADVLNVAMFDSVIVVDIHSLEFLDHLIMPSYNISMHGLDMKEKLVVLPDEGAVERIEIEEAIALKKIRKGSELSFKVKMNVADRDCLIVDDMIDSGKTLCMAAKALMDHGAKSVEAIVTHALFSKETCSLIDASPIQKLTVTDSIENDCFPRVVEVVSIVDIIVDNLNNLGID